MNCPKCGTPDYYQSLFGGGSCMNPTCDDASPKAKAKAGNHFVQSCLDGWNKEIKPSTHGPCQEVLLESTETCNLQPVQSRDHCTECEEDAGACHPSCGQYVCESLDQLIEDLGITLELYDSDEPPPGWAARSYRAVLIREEDDATFSLQTQFSTGASVKKVTVRDVMSCLIQDYYSVEWTSSFEEWAEDLGYDTDSRSSLKTYQEVCKSAKKLEAFLEDHIDHTNGIDL